MDITNLPNMENMGKVWYVNEFEPAESYENWAEFHRLYNVNQSPADLNTVIDFYFQNHKVGKHEYTMLNLIMYQPRLAVCKGINVRGITVSDLGKINLYLSKSKNVLNMNFRWVKTVI